VCVCVCVCVCVRVFVRVRVLARVYLEQKGLSDVIQEVTHVQARVREGLRGCSGHDVFFFFFFLFKLMKAK
jgi:hypothetical protein